MRTCTGCRNRVPQRELVRLVVADGHLVIDPATGPSGRVQLGFRSDPDSKVNINHRQRRRLPGRGAYVHPVAACVTMAGLSRSFRRQLPPSDLAGIVTEMSRIHDNSGPKVGISGPSHGSAECQNDCQDQTLQNASQNAPGHEDGDTVEMPPRIKAKDDRSEDARL